MISYSKALYILNRFKYLYFLLFSVFLFYSCTLVTEPTSVYNSKAAPPALLVYNFSQLSPGQHVDGKIKVTFDPQDLGNGDIQGRVYIDSTSFSYFSYLPYTLQINTRNYSEGMHNIYFYVYQKDNNLGLLNLINAPAKVYGNYLYFDRTPPDQVNLSVTLESSSTRDLTWSQSKSNDFYAYLIYKSVGSSPYVLIDTVYDRNVTSLKDTAYSDLLGVKFQYKVAVTTDNKFTFKTDSNPAGCVLGMPIKYNFNQFNSGPFLNENLSRIYFIVDEKLVAFSTADLSNLAEVALNGLMISPSDYISFNFNFFKSRIYLYNPNGNKLWIINASNLSVIKTLTLPASGNNLYVLDNSRILFFSYNGYIIIDTDTNSILNSTGNYLHLYGPAVVVQDSAKIVCVCNDPDKGLCLFTVLASSSSFNILNYVNINNNYRAIKLAGNKLYCDTKSIYDVNSLNLIGTLNINETVDSYAVTDGFIVTDGLYTYHLSDNYFVSCKKISLYNDQSNKLMQFFVNTNNSLAIDKENIYMGPPPINGTGQADVLGYSIRYGK
jgi:hypothetical protein